MDKPLVTCICPTRNRREWLPKAIACFLAQTYANRELVIIADGEEGVADLVPASDRIRLMVSGWDLTIGEKRNIGCEAARGDAIAHWDDDDYSFPERLAAQIERLQASRKAVTGYYAMKFTNGAHWWLYTGTPASALGTSLCYWRSWWLSRHFFPGRNIGEDSAFVAQAVRENQFVADPDRGLMHGTIHAGNTISRVVSGPAWREIEARG